MAGSAFQDLRAWLFRHAMSVLENIPISTILSAVGRCLVEDQPLSRQSEFDFIQKPVRHRPERPEYVFFGLLAADANGPVAGCRDRIMRDQGIFGSRIGDERLHISLSGLGSFKHIPSRILYGAGLAAGQLSLPPFEVILHRAVTLEGGRPDRHPTVLLAQGDRLQTLGNALFRELGLQRMKAGKTVLPHMTLFYSRQRIRPVDIEPIRLRVDRFHLIHSERGLSRYNLLGSWPLEEPPGGRALPLLAFGSMAA
jgi:2'-5' RNA ligase